jgi:hypothetical protein
MTDKEILEELEDIAHRVGLEVRYDRLEGKGGDCLVKGRPYVIINDGLADEEKITVLASALKRVDLEGVFLKPRIRELLGD